MASLKDGLGGEELAISGLQVGGVSISPYIVGSLTTTSFISGLNVYGGASGTFARLGNADGAVVSLNAGSPGAFGYSLQAGSGATDANGIMDLLFRRAFANTQYFIAVTPGSTSAVAGVQGVIGSMQPVISGIKVTSGVVIYGGPTQPYDYIAVGLI